MNCPGHDCKSSGGCQPEPEFLNTYTKRRTFSDKHLDAVKQLLAPHVIKIADSKTDVQQATDLTTEKLHIAVRIRQAKYLERYKDEFTLRASAANGHASEYDKISSPNGPDYLFYGFACESEITYAVLISLSHWRSLIGSQRLALTVRRNYDGSQFFAFSCLPEYTKVLIG